MLARAFKGRDLCPGTQGRHDHQEMPCPADHQPVRERCSHELSGWRLTNNLLIFVGSSRLPTRLPFFLPIPLLPPLPVLCPAGFTVPPCPTVVSNLFFHSCNIL